MKQKNVILMVVAVGCGLVAAFLTSQMSGKTVEQVEVVVATKDLPVGTVFTQEEVDKCVKTKMVPKDGLPPAYITNKQELIDKRLSRPMRAEETINPNDLNKGIALPEGHDLVSLSVGPSQAASGFVVPGCRVDVMASLKLGNTLKVFDLLVNTLVVNVNHDMTNNKNGVYPDINQVGFALTKKQAILLELARARGCSLTLKLRNTTRSSETDNYDIDETIKLLEDEKNPAVVKTNNDEGKKPEMTTDVKPDATAGTNPQVKPDVKPDVPVKQPDPVPVAPPPASATVRVLVAKQDIAASTPVTNDLIAEAFEWKELPKSFAEDAMTETTDVNGKVFKNGVAKGQWVTWSMVGLPTPKPSPQFQFSIPKPPEAGAEPAKPVVQKKIHDVAIHTTNGTTIHRYAEVSPGQWKKIAELTPEQAAKEARPETPKANPDGNKVD